MILLMDHGDSMLLYMQHVTLYAVWKHDESYKSMMVVYNLWKPIEKHVYHIIGPDCIESYH